MSPCGSTVITIISSKAIPIRRASIKRTQAITNAGEDGRQPWCTASGIVEWYSCCAKQHGVSSKT
jgi:hypothetical protein